MSEQQLKKQAWAWYDTESLKLLHVGFHANTYDETDLEKIEIDYQTALDIASGKNTFHQYEIVRQGDENYFIFKKFKKIFYEKKFWNLLDPERSKFDAKFNQAEGKGSPLEIVDKNSSGFVVNLIGSAKNIVLYVTMKNDPNYLINILELYHYVELADSTIGIKIPLQTTSDYSIYVRYDAT